MGGIYALDQSHLFFYVHPLHDNSCYQTTSIKHQLRELFTNYTNGETKSYQGVFYWDKNWTIDFAALAEAFPPSLSNALNSA